MARYGMVIDLKACTGCRACMEACKVENNTGEGQFWMYTFRLEEGTYPNTQVRFLPRPCQHCDDAPCVKVCPVEARFKRSDGLVLVDRDRCIGCRYCEIACPYGVNYFEWKHPEENQYIDWQDADAAAALAGITGGAIPPYKNPDLEEAYGAEQRKVAGAGHKKGVALKCTFCVHRVEQGLKPACVAACPAFALHFGDLDDPNSEPSQILARNASFRLKEELGTKPRVYYIGQPSPSETAREIEAVVAKE